MSTNVEDTPAAPAVPANGQQSVAELVSGILSDAQLLFRQQIDMVQREFKEDVRRTKQVVLAFSAGAILIATAVVMLVVAGVHLLHEQLQWPMSTSWAVVGGAVLVLGAIATAIGYRVWTSYNPLPDKSFNALQENVSWITNPQK